MYSISAHGQIKDTYERKKAKESQLSPKAGYIQFFKKNAAVLRSVVRVSDLAKCLELSIFCTLEHRGV